eukprot:3936942-Rhodomonas_salina.4
MISSTRRAGVVPIVRCAKLTARCLSLSLAPAAFSLLVLRSQALACIGSLFMQYKVEPEFDPMQYRSHRDLRTSVPDLASREQPFPSSHTVLSVCLPACLSASG